MGSSKTGSLDKFAAFSPAAALASGKVKLPETGIVGILQARQEDKMNQGAQMAQQDDNSIAQYLDFYKQQMNPGMNPGMNMGGRVGLRSGGEPGTLDDADEHSFRMFDKPYRELNELELEEFDEEMSRLRSKFMAAGGPVESMQFLKQHLPYQDGGHVALRRKMFKLGGPVNTHGIGITSGLEYRNNYNAGGPVQQAPVIKPGPDGRLRQHGFLGGMFGTAATVGTAGINQLLRLMANKNARKYGSKVVDEIAEKTKDITTKFSTKDGSKLTLLGEKKLAELMKAYKPLSTAGKAGQLAKYGTTPALAAYGVKTSLDNKDPENRFEQGLDLFGKGALDFSIPGALSVAEDYLSTPVDEEFGFSDIRGLSSRLAGITPEAKDNTNDFKNENLGAPPTSYGDAVDDLQKQQMEEQIARYVELLQGNDDQNKLAMLGDSLIGAGSALMSGEGYGAAGKAFNDPLSEKLRARDDRKQAVRQGAAELAIGQDISRRTADEAMTRELLATGQIGTAEEIKKYNYAMALGADAVVPQNEKEELDLEALEKRGYRGRVLADPRNLANQGALFLAINQSGVISPFNDIEAAKKHAASE